jgi:hypothetical protein
MRRRIWATVVPCPSRSKVLATCLAIAVSIVAPALSLDITSFLRLWPAGRRGHQGDMPDVEVEALAGTIAAVDEV